jgi:hypothetical protein
MRLNSSSTRDAGGVVPAVIYGLPLGAEVGPADLLIKVAVLVPSSHYINYLCDRSSSI